MNLRQHRFVTEYIRHGCPKIAYRIVYQPKNNNFRSHESAANRLLRNPEIAQAIQDIQNAARASAEAELQEQLREELLTIHEKRLILMRIARGDIYIEQSYPGKNCSTCTQLIKPTINQMLKAIDMDNRLAGHYPEKNKTIATIRNIPVSAPVKNEEEVAPATKQNLLTSEGATLSKQTKDISNGQQVTQQKKQQHRSCTPAAKPGTFTSAPGRKITHPGLRKLLRKQPGIPALAER